LQVGAIAGDLEQGGQPAQDHALVVGPGGAAVVGARRGEPVVDQAARTDEAAGVEPVPFPLSPGQVATVPRRALMEQGGEGQEQLVGDGVLVVPGRVPPQATAAGVVPAAGVVGEDGLCRVQVTAVPGHVEGRDPGQRPPPVVVVIVVDEG